MGRRQAIILTNAGILLIGPLGTNFSEILIEIHTFSFKKMHLKTSSGKMAAILSQPQCVNLILPCCPRATSCLGLTITAQRPLHRETQLTVTLTILQCLKISFRADSRFAPSQWEMALLSNDVSHWLGANLGSGADSRFAPSQWEMALLSNDISHWLGANLESALSLFQNISNRCQGSISKILTSSYNVRAHRCFWNVPLLICLFL